MNVSKCWCGGDVSFTTVEGQSYPDASCDDSEFHDPFSVGGTPSERVAKLYVAGPMSGYPECNYPTFHGAEAVLKAHGYTVVNPANSELKAAHYVDFLREDLKWLLDCEGVATLDGWEFSTGARNEVQVAGLLRMPVRPISWWIQLAEGRVQPH